MRILSVTCATMLILGTGFSAFSNQSPAGDRVTWCQPQQPPPRSHRDRDERKPPIMQHDRNRDGKITRAEAPPGLKEEFDRIDANGDGAIDEDEARKHAEHLRARGRQKGGRGDEPRSGKTGLRRHEQGAFEGYTLFAPIRSTTTYLIDMKGDVVHTWESDAPPGNAAYLLDSGNLLRCEREHESQAFEGGGIGGRIREIEWDGTVVWEFVYSDDQHCQHHDIEPLPNGNVLLIAWERKSEEQVIAAGHDTARLGRGELWPDHVVEVKPQRPRSGTVAWEWHVWDHLIQDHDPNQANFGVVGDHPELIDINIDVSRMRLSPEERRRLEALGYMPPRRKPRAQHADADWNHVNAVAYNAELDQIALSVLKFNEIWVIDHSTTSAEAAGHSGGRSGRGGDILYRWGNPQAYRAGSAADQRFFAQHDARWIARGLKGAGNFLVFNNGRLRPDGEYSSIDEISPPVDKEGRYARAPGTAFGPSVPAWVYTAAEKSNFFSGHISGAQRLPNGNTLVCAGEQGTFFEIDQNGRTVWEYVSPFGGKLPEPPPGRGPGGRPRHGPGMRPHAPPPPPPGGANRRQDRPGGRPANQYGVFRATRLPLDHPGLAGKDLRVSGGQP